MTPEEFIKNGPKNPEDLIGKARQVAKVFTAKVKSGVVSPIKLLCYGPPGIGKSATCKILANSLANHPSSIRHMSAIQVTVEHVRDWMMEIRYVSDQWRVYWIEEVDAVTPQVETLLLQFVDLLPEKHAVLFTSNEQMSGIEGRFQSRMQAMKFVRPKIDEVSKFLLEHWPELGDTAIEIAEVNDGDIRASLNDSQMAIDVIKYSDKEK